MPGPVRTALDETFALLDRVLEDHRADASAQEVGRVVALSQGVARVRGLPGVRADELVKFSGGLLGLAFNLDPDEVGVVLLGAGHGLKAGDLVHRTGRITDAGEVTWARPRALNVDGDPLPGAQIVATPVSGTGCQTPEASIPSPWVVGTTDSSGTLKTSLPAGSWTLSVLGKTADSTWPVTGNLVPGGTPPALTTQIATVS